MAEKDIWFLNPKLSKLLAAAEAVCLSADNTGCSEDLTVVSAEAVTKLEDILMTIPEAMFYRGN